MTAAVQDDAPRAAPLREAPELGLLGLALASSAGGLAHQLRNPLNAIVLQLAVVAEKLSGTPEVAQACAGNLEKLRAQVGRADEVLRGWLQAADPAPAAGVEAAQLLADAVAVFGHEARRRRVALEAAPVPAGARAGVDAARAVRLWLGLVWRALEESGEGGAIRLAGAREGAAVLLRVEHRPRPGAAVPAWIAPAVADGARALGGGLEEGAGGDGAAATRTATLRLPAEAP